MKHQKKVLFLGSKLPFTSLQQHVKSESSTILFFGEQAAFYSLQQHDL